MKKFRYLSLITILVALIACEREPEKLQFDVKLKADKIVSTSADTLVVYKNTALIFNMTGNPDIVTFFSGENTHAYEYRARIKAAGTPKLDFYYNSRQVTATQSVDVLASTDFSGITDSLSVKTAKWDTLTPLDMKAYINTNVAKPISTINLSKYASTPVYLAFRLIINSAVRFSYPTFSALTVKNYLGDGNASTIVDGFTAAGMSFVTLSENGAWKNNYGATTTGTTLWKLSSNTITVNTTPFAAPTNTDGKLHELWAVSKLIALDAVMPDAGISAKNVFDPAGDFNYTYTKTGIYKVTFVAARTTGNGVENEVVKEMVVKVVDAP